MRHKMLAVLAVLAAASILASVAAAWYTGRWPGLVYTLTVIVCLSFVEVVVLGGAVKVGQEKERALQNLRRLRRYETLRRIQRGP